MRGVSKDGAATRSKVYPRSACLVRKSAIADLQYSRRALRAPLTMRPRETSAYRMTAFADMRSGDCCRELFQCRRDIPLHVVDLHLHHAVAAFLKIGALLRAV